MVTAVDTNIIIGILIADDRFGSHSLSMVRRASAEGKLIVCEVVWAELTAFLGGRSDPLRIAQGFNLEYDPMNNEAAEKAGELYAKYRAAGGKREHMVADFLVAGHSFLQSDRLRTRDRGFYRKYLRELPLMLS